MPPEAELMMAFIKLAWSINRFVTVLLLVVLFLLELAACWLLSLVLIAALGG